MGFTSNLLRATLVGLLILGVGGRVLMRVVTHMQGGAPILTLEGSVAVVFYGAVAGAGSGVIYYLLQRFVGKPWVRTAAFLIICGLIVLRGVSGSLAASQPLFIALALIHLVIVDVLGRRAIKAASYGVPIATGSFRPQHL